jgi:hypothetical protein
MAKYSVNSVVSFQSVNYKLLGETRCWLEILEDEGALDGGQILVRWRKLDQGSFAGLLK